HLLWRHGDAHGDVRLRPLEERLCPSRHAAGPRRRIGIAGRPLSRSARQAPPALLYERPPAGGRIAQLVEQLTLNQRVPGSSPGAPTNKIRGLVTLGGQ